MGMIHCDHSHFLIKLMLSVNLKVNPNPPIFESETDRNPPLNASGMILRCDSNQICYMVLVFKESYFKIIPDVFNVCDLSKNTLSNTSGMILNSIYPPLGNIPSIIENTCLKSFLTHRDSENGGFNSFCKNSTFIIFCIRINMNQQKYPHFLGGKIRKSLEKFFPHFPPFSQLENGSLPTIPNQPILTANQINLGGIRKLDEKGLNRLNSPMALVRVSSLVGSSQKVDLSKITYESLEVDFKKTDPSVKKNEILQYSEQSTL